MIHSTAKRFLSALPLSFALATGASAQIHESYSITHTNGEYSSTAKLASQSPRKVSAIIFKNGTSQETLNFSCEPIAPLRQRIDNEREKTKLSQGEKTKLSQGDISKAFDEFLKTRKSKAADDRLLSQARLVALENLQTICLGKTPSID